MSMSKVPRTVADQAVQDLYAIAKGPAKKGYPPRWWVDSFMNVVTLRMNADAALVMFDALREHAKQSGDLIAVNMCADIERALYDCGLFGVRAELVLPQDAHQESTNGRAV